jgi:hypothetical protein
MNENKLLTPQERQEFRELEDTFGSPGWRHVKRVLQEEVDQGPAYWFANAENWEQILAARARLRAVYELLNYETIAENRKANLLQGRAYELADKEEDTSTELF